jgi:hypothetical protein
MINKSAPGWTAFSCDHYTSLYSDQRIHQQDGDQDLYSQLRDHLFSYDDQQVGTRKGSGTAISHDHYTSLYIDQQIQQQDGDQDLYSQDTRSFIL